MFRDIIAMPETHYLGFGLMMPWEDNLEIQFNLWKEALNFARFENNCTDVDQRFVKYNALCDEIWGRWLPKSNYISLIEPETFGCVEGYASIEIYTPENPTYGSYSLEMLLPIKRR